MIMLKFRFLLMVLIITHSYTSDEFIPEMKMEYENIESNLINYNIKKEQLIDFCQENILINNINSSNIKNNIIKVFYVDAEIKKIVVNCENSEQKNVISYYLENNNVFFIYSFEKFIYSDEENRYYLRDNKLIKWVNDNINMNKKYENMNNQQKSILAEEYYIIENQILDNVNILMRKANDLIDIEKKEKINKYQSLSQNIQKEKNFFQNYLNGLAFQN